jgi:hypothetical protein
MPSVLRNRFTSSLPHHLSLLCASICSM